VKTHARCHSVVCEFNTIYCVGHFVTIVDNRADNCSSLHARWLFYLGAVLCIGNGLRLMMGAEEESAEETQAEKHDEEPVEIESESTE